MKFDGEMNDSYILKLHHFLICVLFTCTIFAKFTRNLLNFHDFYLTKMLIILMKKGMKNLRCVTLVD